MAADGSVVIQIDGNTEEFDAALKEVIQSVQKLASLLGDKSFSDVAKAWDEAQKSMEGAADAADNVKEGIESLGDGVKTTTESTECLENGFDGVGDSFSSFDAIFKGSFIANLAASAINSVIGALQNLISNVMEAGQQFTSSMSQVAATMGMTVEEIHSGSEAYEMLQEAAKEAGATTAFSASEAADALNYLALAGYSAEQAAEALPAVLNLAAAGGLDLAYASDLATDAMAALGIEASNDNLTKFGDEMAVTASKANTSVAQLGEAILTVGGTAKSLAGGTAELNAALGVLANRGIKGAEGGTALRNVILALSAPTSQAKKALDGLGVSVYDSAGNMRSLNDIFLDLNKALGSLTEGEKTNVLNEIFEKVDLKSAQALLAGCGEEFENLTSAIEASGGAMQNMADVQLDNLSGDLKLLDSALEGLYINIYSALEPALRGMAQTLTGIVNVISSIAEQAPWLIDIIAGAAAAVGLLTAAIVAYKVALMAASAVTAAFSTICSAALGPIIAITAAIGGIGGLLVGFASSVDSSFGEAVQEIRTLSDSADELKDKFASATETFSETAAAISEEHENVTALSSALNDLVGKESKTATDKAAILDIVNQLNAAIPELNLAYDEETDRLYDLSTGLRMTAEDLERFALAQARQQAMEAAGQYLSELYVLRADTVGKLEQAQAALTAAEEEQARVEAELAEIERERGYLSTEEAARRTEAAENVRELQGIVSDLSGQLEQENSIIEELGGKYDELTGAAEDLADATEDLADTSGDTMISLEKLADVCVAAAEETKALTGEIDLCSAALAEQAEEGSISLDTALALIDAGYAAAIAIDEETGAVTLNAEEYTRLAGAKIQTQIATLEVQIAEAEAAQQHALAEAAATDEANAYHRLAQEKLAAAYGDDIQMLELQVAAMNRAMTSLSGYSSAYSGAARSTSSASKKAKTQAEKDLESFKQIQSELEHLRTMDLIDEQEYRDRLEEARDKYLTDDSNIDQYRKITEELHKIDKQFAEDQLDSLQGLADNYETALDGIRDVISDYVSDIQSEYESALNDLQQAQANMASKLAETDLFTSRTDQYSGKTSFKLVDLQDSIDEIYAYRDALQELRARGVGGELMKKITDMSTEDAMNYAKLLAKMTDEQLDEYLAKFEEKQNAAAQVAEEFYAPDIEALTEERDKSIAEVIESLPEDLRGIGEESALALAGGWDDKQEAAISAVRDTREQIESELAKITEMLQNSVLGETLSFSYNLGFNANAAAEKESIDENKYAAQVADALAMTNIDWNNNGTEIVLKLDGTEVGRVLLPSIRAAEDQSPRIVSD